MLSSLDESSQQQLASLNLRHEKAIEEQIEASTMKSSPQISLEAFLLPIRCSNALALEVNIKSLGPTLSARFL